MSVHDERFFTRLIMVVDDYGRFHADPRLLKANLFPLLLDSIRDADILRWTAACEKAGLIVVYENTGKRYLQIKDFKQRLRQMNEKYPPPPDVSQMTVNCQTDDRTKEEEGEEEGRKEETRAHEAFDLSKSNLNKQPHIPTKQKVWEVFSRAGGTKEMAKAFWNQYDATGWFHKGSPIESFAGLAHNFIRNWQEIEKKKTKEDSPSGPSLQILNNGN